MERSFCCLFKLIQNRKCQLISIGIILIILSSVIPTTIIIFKNKNKTNLSTTQFIKTTTTTTTTIETTETITEQTTNSIDKKKWKQNGITVADGNRECKQIGKVCKITGLYIDKTDNETIYTSDDTSNRIIKWNTDSISTQLILDSQGFLWSNYHLPTLNDIIIEKNKDFIFYCDYQNKIIVQLSLKNLTQRQILLSNITCMDLIIDKQQSIYVSDRQNPLIIKWKDKNHIETIVSKQFFEKNNIDTRFSLFHFAVDSNGSIYISYNHRVMKVLSNLSESIVIAGGNQAGNQSTQLFFAKGILFDNNDNLYIADEFNHRIVCWQKGENQGRIIVGGHGKGNRTDQLNNPLDLSFDSFYNLYVIDSGNNRIQKYLLDLF